MLCDICKQNVATVHLTQIVVGKTKKVDLCEACSKEKGVDDPTGFSLADLLLGLGAAQEVEQSMPGGEVKCPRCGFTHADFKKTGRLGCAECYLTFGDGLDSLLKNMHKGTKHTGKAPAAFKQTLDLSDKLQSLQTELDKAVSEEKFEAAAQLRDEINLVKSKITELTIS